MKTTKLLLSTLFLGLAAACGGGGGGDGGGGVLSEAQANDTPGNPTSLGTLDPGETISVRGTISAFSQDQFDNFHLEAAQATSVDFELTAEGSTADLDVWLTNARGEVQQRFESKTAGSETGSFSLGAGEVALLVVTATDADSNYLLAVTGN